MLVAALVECGYLPRVIEQNKEPVTLVDYVGKARPEKAEIVIRRQNTGAGASNDIGFQRQKDGTYKAIVSDYDSRALKIRGVAFVQAVNEAYMGLQADKTVRTFVRKIIPGLRLSGKIPMHASFKVERVGEEDVIKVVA